MLAKNIERMILNMQALVLGCPAACARNSGFQKRRGCLSQHQSPARLSRTMPRAADPLKKTNDLAERVYQNDCVYGADVDAEFQTGAGDDRLPCALLQP